MQPNGYPAFLEKKKKKERKETQYVVVGFDSVTRHHKLVNVRETLHQLDT